MNNNITCLEYIWIDAYGKTRSKTKIMHNTKITEKDDILNIPVWTFDGSSTGQSDGPRSDLIIKPIKLYRDPFRIYKNDTDICYTALLVLCEVYDENNVPHCTNNRYKCLETHNKTLDYSSLFGIEQEYVLYGIDGEPYKWSNRILKQGDHYCGIGGNISNGREIVEEHISACCYAGISICGVNAEVMPSQWEFQIGTINGIDVCDQLWVARYILDRICEKYGCWANYHPKPKDNFNGSGCHTNFSTKNMREENGYDHIIQACKKLSSVHKEHLECYGQHNEERLVGHYEASDINTFTYGVAERGCSVRIPLHVVQQKRGYMEDRRPGSNMDPYLVVEKILNTVCLNK